MSPASHAAPSVVVVARSDVSCSDTSRSFLSCREHAEEVAIAMMTRPRKTAVQRGRSTSGPQQKARHERHEKERGASRRSACNARKPLSYFHLRAVLASPTQQFKR